jgi:copper chaperone CopZ
MERKVSLKISGMHCSGCKNLITLSLEDEGMTRVSVDETTGHAEFHTTLEESELVKRLATMFAELTDYRYADLQITTTV